MSEYIGSVGSKISIEVKMINVYEYLDYRFDYYGTTKYIYTMADADGNVIVWKTASFMSVNLDDKGETWHPIRRGDVIQITGKVKEHNEYKGTKQTVLTRCKFSLIQMAIIKTKEQINAEKAKEQLASITGGDFVWRMPYRQYKRHYSDCETIAGSYDALGTIEVIIREGRLKNSGVRGKHFHIYTFKCDGQRVSYRAVSEENARKQMIKDFPDSANWECTHIF